jgi:glycosyltransferase involved in cell wall biosynthesis
MKILLITQWFTPEPDFKGLPFARELLRRGHDVQVITGFPNYPGGHLYPGYRIRWRQREIMDGVPVLRVPLYPSHDQSKFGRAANYLSFFASASVLGSAMTRKPDVIYAYHPPLTTGLAAAAISITKGVPFVVDIMDMWPDTITATGMLQNSTILQIIDRGCRFLYRNAHTISVVSPGFRNLLIDRGVPSEKIRVIYNWTNETAHTPQEKNHRLAASLGFQGKFVVMFAGTMGNAQALDAVLEAAQKVFLSAPDILFVFVGGGVEAPRLRLRVSGDAERFPNVLFLNQQPMSEIGGILSCADVLLAHLKDSPLFRITIPSKMQSYMAVGKPILMGVMGDAAALVQEADAGLCCRPEDPEDIARAVLQMRRMSEEERLRLGQNGRRFYEDTLSFSAGVNAFENIFSSITRKDSE